MFYTLCHLSDLNGGPKFPQDKSKPINEENVDELHIEGTEQAKEKFITALIASINSKGAPDTDIDKLLIILLEFTVDNHAVQPTDLPNFATKFGNNSSNFRVVEHLIAFFDFRLHG